ncbi:MAG TPA: TPM domain-containing protein, partial [Rhodothermales bacterium]|nr:TPM domain-containing protein [Rhodothermales bacterium]
MRRALASLILLLAALSAMAQPSVLPPSGQWVTDEAGLLSVQERSALSAKLRTYADSTSTQIVIVTLPSLEGADPAQYATELGRQWRVGGERLDNGIVILVSRDDRKTFIATGRGTEGAVPDVLATRIARNVMGPRFREGQFYAGLDEAVNVIISALQGEFQGEAPQAKGEEA